MGTIFNMLVKRMVENDKISTKPGVAYAPIPIKLVYLGNMG